MRNWLKKLIKPKQKQTPIVLSSMNKPLRLQTTYQSPPTPEIKKIFNFNSLEVESEASYETLFQHLKLNNPLIQTCCLYKDMTFVGFNKKNKDAVLVFPYFVQQDTPKLWEKAITFADQHRWSIGVLHLTQTTNGEKITDEFHTLYRVPSRLLAPGPILHKPD